MMNAEYTKEMLKNRLSRLKLIKLLADSESGHNSFS